MELQNIELEELIKVINAYIRDNYEYNYADIFEDCIVYHLENGEVVNVYVNLESESE